jgi:hypothetical protein
MTEPLTECLKRFAENESAFAEGLDAPVVIFEPHSSSRQRLSTFQLHAIPKSGYEVPYFGPFAVVQAVKSRDPKAPRVTVGRTPDNDIVIDDPSVSRLHAWFELKRKRWQMTDAGSRNGTVIEGVRVPGKKWVSLGTQANIGIGDVSVGFFNPEDFVAYLRALQSQSQQQQ